jgi:hypothetical protein
VRLPRYRRPVRPGVVGCLRFCRRCMTGDALPFTAGHLRPGVGPALIVIKRFSRCIGALPFEASGRDGSVAKYGAFTSVYSALSILFSCKTQVSQPCRGLFRRPRRPQFCRRVAGRLDRDYLLFIPGAIAVREPRPPSPCRRPFVLATMLRFPKKATRLNTTCKFSSQASFSSSSLKF